MKIHFMSLYAPNSKFKLHHKRIICRTHEFTRTVFSWQKLKRQKMSDSLLNEHSTTLISTTNRSNMILCMVRNSGPIFLHNCCTRITYFYRAEETVYMTLLFLWSGVYPLPKQWSFSLQISSVNMTTSAGNCGFGHIYWRNPWWKTLFFIQWPLRQRVKVPRFGS